MNPVLKSLRNFFVSLQLTVVLLALSLVLVFAATLAQVDLGIATVQEKFFHSLIALWHVGPLYVPLPGGYLIGGLLLINLIAAHLYRFKMTWRKSGIFLTHAGLILMLVGELLTGLWQQDFFMRLTPGETKNFAESDRHNELVIIETTDPKFDDVVAIPESLLAEKREIQHPKLPFRVVIREYYPNSTLGLRSSLPPGTDLPNPATVGVGRKLIVSPAPLTYKQDDRNMPAAFVELIGAEGSLGTWAVTPQIAASQTFEYGGRTFRIGLRFQRRYEPFSLTLLKVQHDVYPGTDIPKNFSSRVRINTATGSGDREVLIYMNNPLRYGGLTFYQYQMDAEHDASVLQVVRNPSWLIPYISCVMIALGLVVQFGIHLVGFIDKRRSASAPATP